jgi:hypothetical protein
MASACTGDEEMQTGIDIFGWIYWIEWVETIATFVFAVVFSAVVFKLVSKLAKALDD